MNIAAREYFQSAKQAGKGRASSEPKECFDAAEVVRSLTSTKKVLVVARAVPCHKEKNGPRAECVIGFEQEPNWFTQFPTPTGFEWAVIDSSGSIMVHSNIAAYHRHNLFDHVDNRAADRLRMAMAAEEDYDDIGEYRGRRARFHAIRYPTSGWYVIAIGSSTPLELVLKQALLGTAVDYCAFVVLVILLMVIVVATFAGVRARRAKDKADCPESGGNRVAEVPASRAAIVVQDAQSEDSLPRSLNSDSLLESNFPKPRGYGLSIPPPPRGGGGRRYVSTALVWGSAGIILILGALAFASPHTTRILLSFAALLLCLFVLNIPGVMPDTDPGDGSRANSESAPRERRLGIGPAYALCGFAFCTAFVFVPTTISFAGALGEALKSSVLCTEYPSSVLSSGSATPDTSSLSTGRSAPPRGVESAVAVSSTPNAVPFSNLSCLAPTDTVLPHTRDYTGVINELLGDRHSKPREAAKLATFAESNGTAKASNAPYAEQRTGTEECAESQLLRAAFSRKLIIPGLLAVGLFLFVVWITLATINRRFFVDTLEERQRALERKVPSAPSRPILFVFPSPDDRGAKPSQDRILLVTADLEMAPMDLSKVRVIVADFDPLRRVAEQHRTAWTKALLDFFVIYGPGQAQSRCAASRRVRRTTYMRQWWSSDTDEQRVLAQLAIDGRASPHPKNGQVLRHLAGRGLIDDNTLTITDEAWAQYIRNTVSSAQLRSWQAGEADVTWQILKVPLLAIVGGALCLVVVSHPELAESGAVLAAPIAAGLPAVIRLVASVARGKRGENSAVA